MKRTTYTFAILAIFYSVPVFAQSDSTEIVEEEVEVVEEAEAAEEPQMVEVEEIKIEVQEEVNEALDEAMEEVNEALREAADELEELENDPNLSEEERQRVRESREKLMEMDTRTIKITIQTNDGDSIEKEEEHHVIKVGKHEDHGPRLVETDWFRMQFGWANVLNSDKKVEMPLGYENMNFKGNSHSFQLLIVEQAWNMISDQVRLTYGLGFTWNQYNIEGHARLFKDQDGALVPVVDENIQYDRNRLNVNYATMPIGLQFQLGNRGSRRIKIGGGLHLGYLLSANQNIKWEDNGEFRGKITNNFNIEKFRMGYQAQVGYGSFHLYGRYFPNSMFKKDLGPDVNQFSVGVMFGSI